MSTPGKNAVPALKTRQKRPSLLRRIWRHRSGRIGLILVVFLAVVALAAPLLAPFDPYDVTQRAEKGLMPSARHLLGTTINTGQDIFSMLIYGTRVSLTVGIVTGLAIAFVGSFMGLLAGYVGGFVDSLIMRVIDIMLVIPTLPLTIVVTNLLGKSYLIIILVFTLFGWPGLSRVIRAQVLVLKTSLYVRAAELSGARRLYVMFRHILPGVSHLLIMSTSLTAAGIMVAEAGLSFLGLGDPTSISWGKMLAEAQGSGAMLFGHWWQILAPGIGIFLAVFSFMRVGMAMEEIINPKMRRSSGLFKLFRRIDQETVEAVFASMDDEVTPP